MRYVLLIRFKYRAEWPWSHWLIAGQTDDHEEANRNRMNYLGAHPPNQCEGRVIDMEATQ